MTDRLFTALVVLGILVASGCAPSLSPLYRDFEIRTAAPSVTQRLQQALQDAGWETTEGHTAQAVATQERRISSWGIYTVVVSLEAVPVGEDHVRLFFHPYRRYITGNRSKIPYLKKSLRRALMKDLNDAFDAHGFLPIGTSVERDRLAEEQV